jgi:hypothetical protein
MSRKRASQDERIRRDACAQLGAQFEDVRSLVKRCKVLANDGDIDAINAASGLIRANAQLAAGLARVAQIETRHRSIVEKPHEKPQAEPPQRAELNSRNSLPSPSEGGSNEGAKRRLEERLEREVRVQAEEIYREACQDLRDAAPGADPYASFLTWVGEEQEDDEQEEESGDY